MTQDNGKRERQKETHKGEVKFRYTDRHTKYLLIFNLLNIQTSFDPSKEKYDFYFQF